MNDSKYARSNLTKSRWLQLSASVGLAFGLAVVMLLLPIMAGTTVTVTVPTLTQLSSAPDSAGKANWSLTSSSVQLGLPFGVKPVAAVGNITVTKSADVTTAYQGGLPNPNPGGFQPGEIVYTIRITNGSGSDILSPFFISDTVPPGTTCTGTDNNGNASWFQNSTTCNVDRVAVFKLEGVGIFTKDADLSFKFTVRPDGVGGSYTAADYGNYQVINKEVKLQGGPFGSTPTDSGSNPVTVTVKAPVWSITKVASDSITKSGYLTYSFYVTNTGSYSINPNVLNKAPNTNSNPVTITEYIPAGIVGGMVYSSNLGPGGPFGAAGIGKSSYDATTGMMQWVITDTSFILTNTNDGLITEYGLPFTVAFQITSSLPSGYNINNISYTVTGGDNVSRPGEGNTKTTIVRGTELLTVTKQAAISPAEVGKNLTYTIKVIAGGAISNVKLVDFLPPTSQVTFVTYTVPAGGAMSGPNGDNKITMTIPSTTTAGTTYQFSVIVKVNQYQAAGASIDNVLKIDPVAQITTTNRYSDPVTIDGLTFISTITESTPISVQNKVVVTKTVETASGTGVVKPGEAITYTLTVANESLDGLANLVLTDTPETGITLTRQSGVVYGGNIAAMPVFSATGVNPFLNPSGFTDTLVISFTRGLTNGTGINDRVFKFYGVAYTPTGTNIQVNNRISVSVNGAAVTPAFSYTLPSGVLGAAAPIYVANTIITMTKMTSPSVASATIGSVITYVYMITNGSNFSVTNIQLTDNKPTVQFVTPISPTFDVVGTPGSSGTFTASYTVRKEDVDATGSLTITNYALFTASSYPIGTNGATIPVSKVASYSLLISTSDKLLLEKKAYSAVNPSGVQVFTATVKDKIYYAYTATNQSNKYLRIDSLYDDLLDAPTVLVFGGADAVTIEPLGVKVFTATPRFVTLDETDIALAASSFSNGLMNYTNTVTGTGVLCITSGCNSGTLVSFGTTTATATFPVTYTSKITVVKTALVNGMPYSGLGNTTAITPGATLEYNIYVTNTGQVSVSIVPGDIKDIFVLGLPTNLITLTNVETLTLAPGEGKDRSYFFTPTQVSNYLNNNPITLTYFISSMVGTGPLVNVRPLTGFLTNTLMVTATSFTTSLLPAVQNLLATQGVTYAAIISGGTPLSNTAVNLPLTYTALLTIVKAAVTSTAEVNGYVTYTYYIKNIGDVPLLGVAISDTTSVKPNNSTTTWVSGTQIITQDMKDIDGKGLILAGNPIPSPLGVGIGFTVTVSRLFTNMALSDAGGKNQWITNTAIVSGFVYSTTAAVAHSIITETSKAVVVTTSVKGAFLVNKTLVSAGTMSNPVKIGDVVTYSYQITLRPNDTTSIITDVIVTDTVKNLAGTGSQGTKFTTLPTTTLSSTTQSTMVLTKNYTVKDTDLLNNLYNPLYFTNTVEASGQLFGGVEGTGVYLNDADASFGATRTYITFANKITMEKWVMNRNTGVVFTPGVSTEPITANVGHVLVYTYVVYNAGNLGYHDLTIVDSTLPNGTKEVANQSAIFINTPLLAINGRFTATDVFTVDANTKAFVQAQTGGLLENTATAYFTPTVLAQAINQGKLLSATNAGLWGVTATATRTVALSSPTSIDLRKVAVWAGKTMSPTMAAEVDDVVTYTYYITNTGSVDFEPQYNPDQTPPNGGVAITLIDDKIGQIVVPNNTPGLSTGGVFKAGSVVTVTKSYTIGYRDLGGGLVLTNSAKVTGYVSAAFGNEVTNAGFAQAAVPLTYTVNVSVDKSVVTPTGVTTLTLGMAVTYTLNITNDGNVTVTLTVRDVFTSNPLVAAGVASKLTPTVVVLGPMTSTAISYKDSVNPAYLDANIDGLQDMVNFVTVTADDGLGNKGAGVYSDTDSVTLPVEYNIDFELHKEVVGSNVVAFVTGNETVTYRYTVTNTGSTDLTLAALWDTFAPNPPFGQRPNVVITSNVVLLPNVPQIFEWTTPITDSDIPVITNTAVASVTASGSVSDAISIPSDGGVPVTVTITFTPKLQVIKTADRATAGVGDTINYEVTVANIGLVTLRDIIFEDRVLGVINKSSANLSPGGVPIRFVVSHTITLDEYNRLQVSGLITNVAHVTGTRLTDWPFDSNTVTVTMGVPSIVMSKVGSASQVSAGSTVTYTYIVTNNGGADLTGITLTDDKISSLNQLFDLVRNNSVTFTASAPITQDTTNLATATTSGTPPLVATATWTVKVTIPPVTPTNTCTVAVVALSPVVVGTASVMTATVTASPTGVATTTWNFGDNTAIGTGNPISHTYMTTGTKTVTATTTHSNGATCNVATAQVVVIDNPVPTALLSIKKTVQRPQVLEVGTRITYTISVSNTGQAPANNVVITDVLPAEVTLIGSPTTVPSTNGLSVVGNNITVTVPILNANDTASVTIVVEVDNDGIGKNVVLNTAFVSSDQTTVVSDSPDAPSQQADLNDSAQVIKKPTVNLYLPIILKQPAVTEPTATPTVTPTRPPTATATPGGPNLPNLQSSIKLPTGVTAGQAVDVEVVVTNAGTAAVTEGFWVDFYINPNDATGLLVRGGRWDSAENNSTLPVKQGIAWEVKKADLPGGSLAPGASITLVSKPEGDAGLNGRKGYTVLQTTWGGSFTTGTSTLVSYADSFAGSGNPAFLVTESSETDNANKVDFASALGGTVAVDNSPAPFHPAR